MVRKRRKTTRPAPSKVPADPALLDLDLTAWAGERIAHGGEYDQWVPTFGYSGRPDRFGLLIFD